MTIEKKMIRSDIPGSHVFLNGSISYAGTPADDMRRLVVPRDIALNGTVNACDHLILEGTLDASRLTTRRLEILETGLFTGGAVIEDGVIAGRFDGKLVVTGRLTLKPTAHICGEVEYKALEVESGARVDGRLTAMAAAPAEEGPADTVVVLPVSAVSYNVEPLFADDEEEEKAANIGGRAATYRRASGRF